MPAIAANPGAFGFTNVTDPCFNGVTVCANPNQYLFWDVAHPTARGHQLLGAPFAAAVPEPSSVVLLAVGVAALTVSCAVPRDGNGAKDMHPPGNSSTGSTGRGLLKNSRLIGRTSTRPCAG